ncbi:MAG TPA: WG repeat-containing protein, partial [Cyclobacteriaceae bacterium]|nr:WG repeat-containing protein [Cyclobacteriaceae bacterium]
GAVIIPLDYDLVGTPGMIESNVVEVKKDGLVGFYSIEGKQLIAPEYDWIIPYDENDTYALVKRDTTYGWLTKSYVYNAGFPSKDAEHYIKNYEFLPRQFTLSNDEQSMAEIPTDQYIGYGILMPPTYWTITGIFDEIMPGFTKGENMYTGYREYITADHAFIQTVANNISALITTIKERYLEGREEFYEHNQLTFVNARGETLTTDNLYSTGGVVFTKLDNTLLQAKIIENNGGSEEFDMPENGEEWNLPIYKYYRLDNDLSIQPLTSNRRFIQTEFTKLDSSYLMGEFTFYNAETQQNDTRTFLSNMTLTEMRDEILASYGYIFKDEEIARQYSYRDWYKPHYENYADFADQLTDIDRHNLAFLERIIGSLDTPPS